MDTNDYYPTWLGNDIISGTLPRAHAVKTTLAIFLRQYSLHDSYWIDLYRTSQQSGLLIIRWDTFWTHGKVSYPGSTVAKWPILFIWLAGLEDVAITLAEDGIAGAASRLASPQAHAAALAHTRFEDHAGGVARLVHAPGVELLCLNRERDVLEVPLGSLQAELAA